MNADVPLPVLAFDLGGPNSTAALVRDGRIVERRRVLTRRGAGAGAWLDAASLAATAWRGRFRQAVMVEADGSATGELAAGLAHRTAIPVGCLPEALAAAWGEHRFGATPGAEMVFLLVGPGIGGALVSGGALLRGAHGLAGQFGRLNVAGSTLSGRLSGAALLRRAGPHGVRDLDGLVAAARAGAVWANAALDEAADAVAAGIATVVAVLDPPLIVLGGSIGAAPGFVERLHGKLVETTPRPMLRAATLGPEAALLGAADHAARQAAVLAIAAP